MVAVRRLSHFELLYAQVEALPANLTGEIIKDTLLVSPRPSIPHAGAASEIGMQLGPPFRKGKGGPGGWWILYEPELHLGEGPDVLVPDLGGWHMERLPELPQAAFITLPPDWACEVLSPSTEKIDRSLKMDAYAKHGVQHLWLADTTEHALEVYRLASGKYHLVSKTTGNAPVNAEPFAAVALELKWLWGQR